MVLHFIVITEKKEVWKRIQKLLTKEIKDARKAKSLRQAKRMAKRSHNTCIIFDRKLCGKEYRDVMGYFFLMELASLFHLRKLGQISKS